MSLHQLKSICLNDSPPNSLTQGPCSRLGLNITYAVVGGGVSMVSLPTYHSCCTSLKTGGQKYISKSEVAGKVNFPHSDKLKIISEVVFVVHEFQM